MEFEEARNILESCDALLISAGAGMGVDSGLPDFRGTEGLWNAYPPLMKQGLSLPEISTPRMFDTDPELAWGFFGHRLVMYSNTIPHQGFDLLLNMAKKKKFGAFVFTSNVDGQFQKAGFQQDQIYEVHGSIHYLQCTSNCKGDIWSADSLLQIPEFQNLSKELLCLSRQKFPHCRNCGALARPNILMFGDSLWESKRSAQQEQRLEDWILKIVQSKSMLGIIEIGAGLAVPTVRYFSEHIVHRTFPNSRLIRINPRDYIVPFGQISLRFPALEALKRILK